ncbi:chaperonin 10-like protein [Microdochium trichocladiopsis]|uniref:Chaperonin 10-like protein n=1 Tax=Microdochium trichocladiopsis TaxID=1682393 RepID=A0A9P9BZ94_9PEZI|nr:chaperonin 10-like protein [Microdochium trichocladiopsis]KAH7039869.1 chaperonin 10-like protein [Microdochium trichocladiopsis]
MAEVTNTALYMDRDCQLSVKRNYTMPVPQADEVLVKVQFSGVNPADVRHGTHLGITPVVLGYDFSGHVVSCPPDCGLSPGDAVAGMTPTGVGRPARYGAHQEFLACPVDCLFRVPGNLPMHHAACLPVVACTAADVLFNVFGFPLPQNVSQTDVVGKPAEVAARVPDAHESTQTKHQAGSGGIVGPLLIWGGSAAVGSCAIQLARACGVKSIIVTASPARHEMLRRLGATHCFDYHDAEVGAKILAAVEEQQEGPIRYALDAAGSFGNGGGGGGDGLSSFEQMTRCGALPGNGVVLVSVVAVGSRAILPFASRARDVTLAVRGQPQPIVIPADEAKAARTTAALQWVVGNYGEAFVLPAVDIWSGSAEDALVELERVEKQGRFGKMAVQHPLQS